MPLVEDDKPWSRVTIFGPALASTALAFAFALLWTRPADPALRPVGPGEGVPVYLVHNGFHANLVAPAQTLRASGGPAARAAASLPASPWIAVGWGDARFYTETGFSPRRALDAVRAALAPDNPSVVMLEPLRDAPDRLYATGVIRIELSREGFARMTRRLDRSFQTRAGRLVDGPRPASGPARSFRSTEDFHLTHLCNHWAAELLNAGGVPVRPAAATLPGALAVDVERARALDSRKPGA
ncbi:MAG TPA: DUF2459 domain-containing protein [Caulobacteraceae bacterium]|nr:DUF2459 domain-containing protein [Caulobacteraceae bacterium]